MMRQEAKQITTLLKIMKETMSWMQSLTNKDLELSIDCQQLQENLDLLASQNLSMKDRLTWAAKMVIRCLRTKSLKSTELKVKTENVQEEMVSGECVSKIWSKNNKDLVSPEEALMALKSCLGLV